MCTSICTECCVVQMSPPRTKGGTLREMHSLGTESPIATLSILGTSPNLLFRYFFLLSFGFFPLVYLALMAQFSDYALSSCHFYIHGQSRIFNCIVEEAGTSMGIP